MHIHRDTYTHIYSTRYMPIYSLSHSIHKYKYIYTHKSFNYKIKFLKEGYNLMTDFHMMKISNVKIL